MSDIVLQRDAADLLSAQIASAFDSATAAGTGDDTKVTGVWIDRLATGSVPLNAEFLILWEAVLAATKTLSITGVQIEQSDDGVNADSDPFATFTDPGVVGTGATGGSTERGVVKIGVDLGSAKRYIRIDFTPDLSATATDTAKVVAAVNLAGFDRLPAA